MAAVLEFFHNPFSILMPGGSPSEPWRKPPTVHLGGRPYLVFFYWTRKEIELLQSGDALATHFVGVCGQAKVRADSGEEFYVRIHNDKTRSQVWLIPTGFRGEPFTSSESQEEKPNVSPTDMPMNYLECYRHHILEVYADDPENQPMVREALAECTTFGTVQNYLASFWDKKSMAQLLEEFFKSKVEIWY
jgi:hypothetical protein